MIGSTNSIKPQIVNTPILLSLKFLAAVIEFWTDTENQMLLNKGAVMSGDANKKGMKQQRLDFIQTKIYKYIKKLDMMQPVFSKPEIDSSYLKDMSQQSCTELAKQCFYLNVFNAMVLFKITEIATIKPTKLFGLQNHSSWIALL